MIQRDLNQPRLRMQLWSTLATSSLLVAELTLAALWYQALFRPHGVPFSLLYLTLAAIFAGSHGLARLLGKLKWRMRYRQIAMIAWVLICIYASLKGLLYAQAQIGLLELLQMPVSFILRPDATGIEFMHSIYILVLIWRGVSLSRAPLTLYGAQVSFQVGLILLLLYGMGFALFFKPEATVGMYLFLFFGLTSMSLARISNLTDLRGGRMPRFGSGWVASILLASLALVGLAILTGWLASGNVVFILASVLAVILAVLTALFIFLLSPLLVFLANLVPYIIDLINQIMNRLGSLPISEQVQKLLQVFNEGLTRIVPLMIAGRGIFLALLLGGLILVIVLALRLRDIFQRLAEEDEAVGLEPGERENLLKLLARRLRNARRKLRSPVQILAAARIRQIYKLMMLLCQKLGDPRPPSSTPLEFLPHLESLFPEEQTGARTITAAYVKVRYGEYPETRGEVEAVEEAWRRLKRQGRRTLAVKKG